MIEIKDNMWNMQADLRCITTNGDVNKKGQAVMGRGCALEAKSIYPGIEYHFAELLKRWGNRVMLLREDLCCFPVKHHWNEKADLELIEKSVEQLQSVVDKFGYTKILLPRPGCGNGQLNWSDVKPLVEVLDDRFIVVTMGD